MMKWCFLVLIGSLHVLSSHAIDGGGIFQSAANELASLLKFDTLSPRLPINNQVDELFAALRVNISESGLDPLPLPTDSDDFNVTIFDKTIFGSVSVSNTRLGGISTIHRTGYCEFIASPLSATIYVGGNDILLGVDVSLGVGIINTKIKVSLYVAHVDLMLSIQKNDEGVVLSDIRLNEIGRIKFSIEGIPGGGSDTITNRLTAVSNLVKDSLTYAFQEAIRNVIESLINGKRKEM